MALRPVEIAIRAKDQTKAGIQSATTGLERFAAAQARTNSRRKQIQDMRDDAVAVAGAYKQAADRANELGRQIANTRRPSKALRDEFAATRAEASRLRNEAIQVAAALGRTTGQVGQRGSFEQFDRIASSANRAENAIDAETAALNRNTGALRRNAAAGGGRRGDLADRITGSAASRNDRGPLGLRPYELQNLSYQVNDFFTQIASGTPITQAFAQQFGQVAQLFPAAISGFIRFIPIIGLATLALAPFVSKLAEVNNEAKNLDTFEKALARSGERAAYSAGRLAQIAKALDEFGVSADEARAIVNKLITESIDPAYLERFGRAAVEMSKALGIDVAEATDKVTEAFAGNADSILALDDEINFLTDSERKHIEKLRQSKKEAEARTYAFGIFEQRYQEIANKTKGPWSQILSDFTGAWKAFADFVTFIDFTALKNDLNIIAGLLAKITGLLPGARSGTAEAYTQQIERNNRQIANYEAFLARGGAQTGRGRAMYEQSIARLRADNDRLKTSRDVRNAFDNGGLLGLATASDTTLDPGPGSNLGGGRRRGESDADKAAKRRAELLEDLRKSNEARAFELSLVDETAREAEVLREIESERLKFAEEGMTLTEAQTKSIRDSVTALYDANAAKEAQKTIDAASLELLQARNQVESESAFVTRKLTEANLQATSEIDATTGDVVVSLSKQAQEYSNILRLIYQINEQNRQRTEKEKAVNELVAIRGDLIEQIQFYEDQGQAGTADRLRTQLVAVNEQLSLAVDDAINFWTAFGGEGAQAALLRLGLLRDQLAGIGQTALFSGKQINDWIVDGAVKGFDAIAEALANGENAIVAMRDAFLQFAADFLRQIAVMIMQQAILNALQAGSGGGGGTGGSLAGFFNGLFGSSAKSLPVPVKHGGGIIGSAGRTRMMPVSNDMLQSRETWAILRQGEEVLTDDDPRHARNRGGVGGGRPMSLKNINLFSAADMLRHAMSDEDGQEVILNDVRNNQGAWRAALGV